MIKVTDLSFKYGNTDTLSNISLDFELGKIYGIIGPNGSGKSTILKLLARQLDLQQGEITIDGKPTRDYPRNDFAKKISYLPQQIIKTQMTVMDFVSFGRFPYLPFSKKLCENDYNIVKKQMYITDIEHLSEKQMCNLSGGEQQRAHIAMVLTQDTPYILLDEPTSSLDISSKFSFFEKFREISNNGKCIIAVIHDISLALHFCDTIILLNGGKIISVNSPSEIVKNKHIDDVFKVTCKEITVDNESEFIIRR